MYNVQRLFKYYGRKAKIKKAEVKRKMKKKINEKRELEFSVFL